METPLHVKRIIVQWRLHYMQKESGSPMETPLHVKESGNAMETLFSSKRNGVEMEVLILHQKTQWRSDLP